MSRNEARPSNLFRSAKRLKCFAGARGTHTHIHQDRLRLKTVRGAGIANFSFAINCAIFFSIGKNIFYCSRSNDCDRICWPYCDSCSACSVYLRIAFDFQDDKRSLTNGNKNYFTFAFSVWLALAVPCPLREIQFKLVIVGLVVDVVVVATNRMQLIFFDCILFQSTNAFGVYGFQFYRNDMPIFIMLAMTM